MTRGRVAPLAIAITLAATPASAQSTVAQSAAAKSAGAKSAASVSAGTVSQADALFTEAKTLRDSGSYPEACAKFAASDRLAPGIGVALYLGDCYERIGKTASAWVSFRAAEKRANERKDERTQVAHDRAKMLEPKLSRITFAVAPSLHRRGVEVWLDDTGPVPPESYSLGIAADPGNHVVALKFAGRTVRTVFAQVTTGGTTSPVTLTEPPLPPAPPTLRASAPVQSDTSMARSDSRDSRGPIELGLLVLGGVGLAAGAGLLLAKNGSATNSAAGGGPSFDQGASAGSVIGFAIAGSAFATAVVLYLTTPKRKDASAPVILAPMPLVGGGGVALEARF